MGINTIISDVGGVLIKNYDISNDVRSRLGLSEEVFRPLWEDLVHKYGSGEIDEQAMWTTFNKRGGQLVEIAENLFGNPFAEHLQVYPKVGDLMKSLGEQGYQLAILSDTNANHATVLRDNEVYAPFADNVFLSHETGFRKPNPLAYTNVLSALQITNPSTVLFIDDNEANVRAANELGINGLHVNDNEEAIIDSVLERLKDA